MIDGAGKCRQVWYIILRSITFEWFYAFLYINDTVKLPLQVVLRNILTAGMIEDTEMIPIDHLPPAQSPKTAMVVVTVAPILCVTPSSSVTSSRS